MNINVISLEVIFLKTAPSQKKIKRIKNQCPPEHSISPYISSFKLSVTPWQRMNYLSLGFMRRDFNSSGHWHLASRVLGSYFSGRQRDPLGLINIIMLRLSTPLATTQSSILFVLGLAHSPGVVLRSSRHERRTFPSCYNWTKQNPCPEWSTSVSDIQVTQRSSSSTSKPVTSASLQLLIIKVFIDSTTDYSADHISSRWLLNMNHDPPFPWRGNH